jgi:phosphate transport system protein
MMRDQFNQQLRQLHIALTEMGGMCQQAISLVTKALLTGDHSLLQTAFSVDEEIDHKERDIEALCMKLLLQQQPVARDLRNISAALKMISDMERIGDQATDIGELARFISPSAISGGVHIADMARATVRMVTEAVDSFIHQDLALARKVMADDDEVDGLFLRVKNELQEEIVSRSPNSESCLDLMMVAKYLERIGDHATNIAEWVEFSITGVHPKDEKYAR